MKWISVKDRLPEYTCHAGSENFVHVLACGQNWSVGEVMYCNGKFEKFGIELVDITHWMPLPSPPIDKD